MFKSPLKRALTRIVGVMVCGVVMSAQAAVQISSAQLTAGKKSTRLVLESSAPIAHSTSQLNHPDRLVLDLHDVRATAVLDNLRKQIGQRDAVLKSVQVQRQSSRDTRLVFTLKTSVQPQVLAVGPLAHKRYRLTVELHARPEEATANVLPDIRPTEARDVNAVLLMNLGASRDEPIVILPRPDGRNNEARNADVIVIKPKGERGGKSSNITFENAPDNGGRPHLTVSDQLHPQMTFYNETDPAVGNRPKLKMSIIMDESPRSKPAKSSKRLREKTPKLRASQSLQVEQGVGEGAPAPFIRNAFLEESFAASANTPPVEEPNVPHGAPEHHLLVALDAGHGGVDPGALGYYGSSEKNITLAIARRVQALLAKSGNVRGVLTRSSDVYIPLADRVELAHQAQADLFVSIHADAFIDSKARGSSVFMLSKRGASSTAASWLANKENSADLIGAVNVTGNKDPFLVRTLFDLSQTAAVKDSQKLADSVLHELGGINALHRQRVEQAGFAVLKSPRMPSILVETAFISNPTEESRLNSTSYQTEIAQAIVRGIQRYFSQNPRMGRSKLAQNS